MKYPLSILIFALSASSHAGEIYTCTSPLGRPVFSDAPCGTNKTTIQVKTQRTSQTEEEAAQSRKRLETAGASMYTTRRQAELKGQIRDREGRIDAMRRTMDTEISQLKAEQALSSNNLAGSTRSQSLSARMQAVTTQYEIKIKGEQEKLQAEKEELATLK